MFAYRSLRLFQCSMETLSFMFQFETTMLPEPYGSCIPQGEVNWERNLYEELHDVGHSITVSMMIIPNMPSLKILALKILVMFH